VLPSRPRRNRRSPTIRGAVSETHIAPANLILPVFIHDGEQNLPIASMPGVDRLGWRHGLLDSVAEARSVGVNSVVLFPKARARSCARPGCLATACRRPCRRAAAWACLVARCRARAWRP
jgi:delta-aminolevulinic acid dehydratase/porphobilinogen synthase